MKTEELAWAAGFFDGEGCVRIHKKNSPVVSIVQVDRFVLDRFRQALSVGNINGPYNHTGVVNHQPAFWYQAWGFEKNQAIMAMLWNWLSPIKKEQFRKVMSVLAA